jgi:hypothetical protein
VSVVLPALSDRPLSAVCTTLGVMNMLQMVTGYFAVILIAVLYYAWRDGIVAHRRKRAQVNERVAYMLWCAANRSG